MKLALTFYSVLKMPVQDIMAYPFEAEKRRPIRVGLRLVPFRWLCLVSAIASDTAQDKRETSVMR